MTFTELKKLIESDVEKNASDGRFGIEIARAHSFMSYLFPKSGWEFSSLNKDVTISSLAIEELYLPAVRGDGNYRTKFSPEEWTSVIRNRFARFKWDPRFDESQVLEFIGTDSTMIYSVQKGSWPIGPRDLLTINSITVTDDSSEYISHSIDDSYAPESRDPARTRAVILIAGWRITSEGDQIKASYVVHVDPKGSIPSCIAILTQRL